MLITLALIISSLIVFLIPFAPEMTYGIVKCEFIIYIFLIIVDILKVKRLTLLHIWIASYIFIILSEMLIVSSNDFLHEYTIPIFFYLLANNLVIIGYKVYKPRNKSLNKKESYKVDNPKALLMSLMALMALYILMNYEKMILTLYLGRNFDTGVDHNAIVDGFLESFGIVVPCFIGYYFRFFKQKNVIYSILLSLPIFAYQVIMSTRYKLFFTILPFLFITGVITPHINNTKKNILFIILIITFGLTSSYIKENRNYGYIDVKENEYVDNVYYNDDEHDFFQVCAKSMSPEGVIYMAKKANEYFNSNPLSYGKETSYILYFWVPRAIWPNKPSMLGHWLIRKTENVADTHSTSSGFMGELRADFGWFSLFFALLIGFAVRIGDAYINRVNVNSPDINFIVACILYPYVFFFVRSPITATITLIGELIVIYIFKLIFFTKVKNTTHK